MRTVEVDRKGRVVIPKDIRERGEISTPGELLVTVDGTGKIGLHSVETGLRKAKEIGRKKLSSWKERKHEEDKLASKLALQENSE